MLFENTIIIYAENPKESTKQYNNKGNLPSLQDIKSICKTQLFLYFSSVYMKNKNIHLNRVDTNIFKNMIENHKVLRKSLTKLLTFSHS